MALGIFFSFFLVIFCSSSLQWPSCDLHKKKKTEQTQMEHENAGGYVKKTKKIIKMGYFWLWCVRFFMWVWVSLLHVTSARCWKSQRIEIEPVTITSILKFTLASLFSPLHISFKSAKWTMKYAQVKMRNGWDFYWVGLGLIAIKDQVSELKDEKFPKINGARIWMRLLCSTMCVCEWGQGESYLCVCVSCGCGLSAHQWQ